MARGWPHAQRIYSAFDSSEDRAQISLCDANTCSLLISKKLDYIES